MYQTHAAIAAEMFQTLPHRSIVASDWVSLKKPHEISILMLLAAEKLWSCDKVESTHDVSIRIRTRTSHKTDFFLSQRVLDTQFLLIFC